MVASLKDIRTEHRPMQGVIFGTLIGALLWVALIVIVVAL